MTVTTSTPLEWTGDPTVLVYAVRYVLGRPGSHAPELLRQTLTANAEQLPPGARTAITRDITSWLDGDGQHAPAVDRLTWTRALQAVRAPRAKPLISRKDLHR